MPDPEKTNESPDKGTDESMTDAEQDAAFAEETGENPPADKPEIEDPGESGDEGDGDKGGKPESEGKTALQEAEELAAQQAGKPTDGEKPADTPAAKPEEKPREANPEAKAEAAAGDKAIDIEKVLAERGTEKIAGEQTLAQFAESYGNEVVGALLHVEERAVARAKTEVKAAVVGEVMEALKPHLDRIGLHDEVVERIQQDAFLAAIEAEHPDASEIMQSDEYAAWYAKLSPAMKAAGQNRDVKFGSLIMQAYKDETGKGKARGEREGQRGSARPSVARSTMRAAGGSRVQRGAPEGRDEDLSEEEADREFEDASSKK